MARTKKSNEQKVSDFHAMLTEIWQDYMSGKVEWDRLNVHPYCEKWHVGCFPKRLLTDTLLRRTAPTADESASVRSRATQYQTDRHILKGERGGEVSAETMQHMEDEKKDAAAAEWTEESAIAYLKKVGKYRVTKKVTAYVYV